MTPFMFILVPTKKKNEEERRKQRKAIETEVKLVNEHAFTYSVMSLLLQPGLERVQMKHPVYQISKQDLRGY